MDPSSWPIFLLKLLPVDLEPKAWFKPASDQILSDIVLNLMIGDLLYCQFRFGIAGIPINRKGEKIFN